MIYDERVNNCLENMHIFRTVVFSLPCALKGKGLYYNRDSIFLNERKK
jgi:hypothetical protein